MQLDIKNKMCGISGYFKNNPDTIRNLELKEISEILSHRGPDHFNYWNKDNLYLYHNRLSILDLSDSGNQPMHSFCNRYIITYNGEIYNFKELKREIDLNTNINWQGTSDTEILVNSISVFGIKNTLQKVRGMFAIVIWDKIKKNLILIRDRVGQKPLYYGLVNGNFIFSSELKFFNKILYSKPKLNLQAASLMIEYGYVPTPLSIYHDIYKLEQGGMLIYSAENNKIEKNIWWSKKNLNNKYFFENSDFNQILTNAVREQMISDVPIGAFLSGGLDSTLIVSILQSLSSNKIKTFTVGFDQNEYNESIKAKKIANYLGTDHHEITFNNYDLKNILSDISNHFDEPFADSSQIPTMLVSKFASEHVKVCLSGDAGDELFGGYNRYMWLQKIKTYFSLLPTSLRKKLYHLTKNANNIYTYKLINALFGIIINNPSNKISKLNAILNSNSYWDSYYCLISQWNNNLPFVKSFTRNNLMAERFNALDDNSSVKTLMDFDFNNYLCDDILVKLDRSAMSSSLETRIPYLDERVIEYANAIPLQDKIRGNKGKIPIRNLLNKYIPKSLINYPKQGFGIPLNTLLRNNFKNWAEEILFDHNTYSDEFLDKDKIQTIWNSHQSGVNHEYALWTVIMFASWKNKWL